MVMKLLAAGTVFVICVRLFVRRDSEIARRFRLFVDVSLVLLFVLYGVRIVQLYLR